VISGHRLDFPLYFIVPFRLGAAVMANKDLDKDAVIQEIIILSPELQHPYLKTDEYVPYIIRPPEFTKLQHPNPSAPQCAYIIGYRP